MCSRTRVGEDLQVGSVSSWTKAQHDVGTPVAQRGRARVGLDFTVQEFIYYSTKYRIGIHGFSLISLVVKEVYCSKKDRLRCRQTTYDLRLVTIIRYEKEKQDDHTSRLVRHDGHRLK